MASKRHDSFSLFLRSCFPVVALPSRCRRPLSGTPEKRANKQKEANARAQQSASRPLSLCLLLSLRLDGSLARVSRRKRVLLSLSLFLSLSLSQLRPLLTLKLQLSFFSRFTFLSFLGRPPCDFKQKLSHHGQVSTHELFCERAGDRARTDERATDRRLSCSL